MAKTLLSSAVFDAGPLMRELENLLRVLPPDAITLPNVGSDPAGAHVFHGAADVRLIVQYQIQTDTHVARFDVLIETPDA